MLVFGLKVYRKRAIKNLRNLISLLKFYSEVLLNMPVYSSLFTLSLVFSFFFSDTIFFRQTIISAICNIIVCCAKINLLFHFNHFDMIQPHLAGSLGVQIETDIWSVLISDDRRCFELKFKTVFLSTSLNVEVFETI